METHLVVFDFAMSYEYMEGGVIPLDLIIKFWPPHKEMSLVSNLAERRRKTSPLIDFYDVPRFVCLQSRCSADMFAMLRIIRLVRMNYSSGLFVIPWLNL